ncbi:MAG TPA: hypothetical protein VFJ19_07000 [Nocardioidaceae bacterium]|nr:hypothetical protein [Nocardioidaceae bacterium]
MTTVLTVCWTVLVPLAQHTPPASKVKAGWVGFAVVIALILAAVFLFRSFTKQLRKVRFEEEPGKSGERSGGADENAPEDRTEPENGRPGPTQS